MSNPLRISFSLQYNLLLCSDRRRYHDDGDDRHYDTPNIRNGRDTPSRSSWDDDEPDRARSQWENPTPNDRYRHGHRKVRDTDYYNRKKNDTPLPTPSFLKSKRDDYNNDDDDRKNWEEDQKVRRSSSFMSIRFIFEFFSVWIENGTTMMMYSMMKPIHIHRLAKNIQRGKKKR